MNKNKSQGVSAEAIAKYFNVLPPHSQADRSARSPGWAQANAEHIAGRLAVEGPERWYSKIEIVKDSGIFSGPVAVDATADAFYRLFDIEAADLAGKRVLDIGAFSGAMSFYAEDCGAEVIAVDIQHPGTNGFGLVHDIRQSLVIHVTAAIYDLHPSLFGLFDIIVFSGVHYHLKHPLLALERLNALMAMGGELLAVGTSADLWLHKPGDEPGAGVDLSRITRAACPEDMHIDNINEVPLLGFYKDSFIPNTAALADMIAASGFDVVRTATSPADRSLIGRPISCSLVKARKSGDPKPEYSPEVYAHVRRVAAVDRPSTGFSIPTWYELEEARRRLP
jgi:SAM-dependent methyltransferase